MYTHHLTRTSTRVDVLCQWVALEGCYIPSKELDNFDILTIQHFPVTRQEKKTEVVYKRHIFEGLVYAYLVLKK